MTTFRKERAADVLLSFLAQELNKMRDPRLQSVTLTDVEMSPDLKLARIFWTAHLHQQGGSSEEGPKGPEPSEVKAIEKALQGAGRYLKRRIGEELDLRSMPELLFRFDESLDRGNRIDFLLSRSGQ